MICFRLKWLWVIIVSNHLKLVFLSDCGQSLKSLVKLLPRDSSHYLNSKVHSSSSPGPLQCSRQGVRKVPCPLQTNYHGPQPHPFSNLQSKCSSPQPPTPALSPTHCWTDSHTESLSRFSRPYWSSDASWYSTSEYSHPPCLSFHHSRSAVLSCEDRLGCSWCPRIRQREGQSASATAVYLSRQTSSATQRYRLNHLHCFLAERPDSKIACATANSSAKDSPILPHYRTINRLDMWAYKIFFGSYDDNCFWVDTYS